MTPSISVLVATRGRVPQLERMLQSCVATAVGAVEIVLRVDYDDAPTIDYLRGRGSERFIVGPRLGYASMAAMVNDAARLSCADLAMVVNDDVEFVTAGWDRILGDIAARYPDGIFDLGVETLNAGNFVWPCTSRRVIEAIGIHEARVLYSDIWLRDVMRPFGRAIRVPEVTILHHWQGQTDDQQRALRAAQASGHQAVYAQCVEEGRQKIGAMLALNTLSDKIASNMNDWATWASKLKASMPS